MTPLPTGATPNPYARPPEVQAIPTAAEPPGAWKSGPQGAGASEVEHHDVIRMTRQVLEGVDFMTRLSYSAIYGGPDFKRIASTQGIDPMLLDSSSRQSIEAHVNQQFLRAAEFGNTPISRAVADKWLKEALDILTK